jgi:hypothetical protein
VRLVLLFLLVAGAPAAAQSFEAGVHCASARWSEFDGSDLGVGGRFTWRPMPIVGIDAELTWYPSEYPDSRAPFSDARIEGLFGVHAGPRLGPVRPFAKAAAGFLRVASPGEGFACIAIFPPPLACLLAGGATLPAYELGGGIEINSSSTTFIRVDIADRILKYPGPAFRFGLQELEEKDFLAGELRFTVGGGVRF